MSYVVGVDIGTQSTKALLCDEQGRIVAQHVKSYRVDTPRPLWAEQWPAVWLEAVVECIAGCVAAAKAGNAGFEAVDVRAVCISSLYGGSGIPVDDRIRPLHPCLIWMDRRATAEVEWVRRTIDVERLGRITGNGIDSYYGYTKMLWLRNNRPEVFGKTRYFLPPNSFVIHALTGEVVVGGLTTSAAGSIGLAAGTPVVAGGVDAAMATLAAGVTRAGQHVAMIGSSMCWGYISQRVDPGHGLVSMPNVFGGPNDSYVFGGAITAGAAVTWFRDQFCRDAAASAQIQGADMHDLLDAEAREVPAGSEGVLFLPYLMGERSPIWDGKASGAFVGFSLFHQRKHLYRAVLEGVTFALRHNIEAGARGAASLDEELVVVGGAAHSDLWMQIIADVTRRPVLTIEQDVEAAMGAAILAAHGVGLVTAEQVRRGWVNLVPRARPRSDAAATYDRAFDLYKGLYPSLKGTLHGLHEVRNAELR